MSEIMKSNPFFTVERKKIEVPFGDGMVDTKRDVLLNADNGSVLGIVGRGYQFVHHNTVASIVEEALAGSQIQEFSDHINGVTNRWVREYVLDGAENTFDVTGKGDTVKTKLRIFNGYDGRTSMGFEIAAWRKICSNGMMGWKRMMGKSYYHVDPNMVSNLRNDFDVFSNKFRTNIDVWRSWTEVPFTKEQFEQFIKTRDYLSEKQIEGIMSLYDATMNKYNENETKWGNYNVLTAIASHHTKARKGSNIFSNAYKRMSKLAGEFFDWKPSEKADGTEGRILIPVSND